MDSLRNFFIVEELQAAAIEKDEQKLRVVREIVRRTKLIQLEVQEIADDAMMTRVLDELHSDLQTQVKMVAAYMDKAKSN